MKYEENKRKWDKIGGSKSNIKYFHQFEFIYERGLTVNYGLSKVSALVWSNADKYFSVFNSVANSQGFTRRLRVWDQISGLRVGVLFSQGLQKNLETFFNFTGLILENLNTIQEIRKVHYKNRWIQKHYGLFPNIRVVTSNLKIVRSF